MMSVIPLTTEGATPTVIQDQGKFDPEGRAVLILDLDEDQLLKGRASNVSYDLRVGRKCRDHRETTVREIPTGGKVTLRPNSALIIQTEEYLHLPRRMFGTIAPKVSLLELGLSSTFSKVDPGYPGHLLITLFNLGKTTVSLRRGECFCALTLYEVAPGARLYGKGPKEITSTPTKQPRRSLREWIELHVEAHLVMATIGLMIVTLLLAGVELVRFLLSMVNR
jgi:deoxycytidine triphosphate deaminase